MSKSIKVRVPQKDGSITISHATPDPLTFTVADGIATAADDFQADLLLRIEGSSLVESPK